MKSKLNNKTTKYLLITLFVILVFAIVYYCIVGMPSNESSPIPYEKTESLIEPFNNNQIGYNQSKMIVVYTASWCPHCRSFMGMSDEKSPISDTSEFAKLQSELGNCFENVKDTDPNSSKRMQSHGVSGYPGFAFVDKQSDVGISLGNTKRTSSDICAKFRDLSS